MPEVFRRKVADRSVRRSLSEMRNEFLPTEVREDANARWVMRFDDLRERAHERQTGNPRESDFWALDLVVTSTLQRQIPFYFASLFHIGRQWKVSESAVGALAKASTAENLRTSAGLTIELLNRRNIRERSTTRDQRNIRFERSTVLSRTPDITAEALGFVLTSSAEEHATRLRESQQWWRNWQQEVEGLRHRVERIQELAGREFDHRLWREISTLVLQRSRPSQLRMAMESAGITFPHQPADNDARSTSIVSELLWPLLLVALGNSKFREPFAHELMFEVRHVLHEVKEETAHGDSRRIALERLGKKYAQSDPFERYLPLQQPADEPLRNLILEHTLPAYGRTFSPWLATWKQCIEYDTSKWRKVAPKDMHDEKVIEGFARSADCAIKDKLPDQFAPNETWDDLLQRLFESAWITTIANQIVSTNNSLSDMGWTFESFTALVEGVAARLNRLGYRLTPPALSRLETLWNKLHSDKRWTDEEW